MNMLDKTPILIAPLVDQDGAEALGEKLGVAFTRIELRDPDGPTRIAFAMLMSSILMAMLSVTHKIVCPSTLLLLPGEQDDGTNALISEIIPDPELDDTAKPGEILWRGRLEPIKAGTATGRYLMDSVTGDQFEFVPEIPEGAL